MRIKLIYWIGFLWIFLIIFRIEAIINYALLLPAFFGLMFNNINTAMSLVNFQFIDSIFSFIIIILIPFIIVISYKKKNFLNKQIRFSEAVIILLLFVFILTPLIAASNPGFSKDLSVTKLLSPFSKVKIIHLKSTEKYKDSDSKYFLNLRDKIIKPSFDESIIFADSINAGDKFFYYQKNVRKELPPNSIKTVDGREMITDKIFLLGTDEFGRDIFSRLIYGTRISLLVGLASVIVAFLIGVLLGFIAGYTGGIIDVILNRFTELFLSFPSIYLIILILALFGNSLFTVIFVLGISGWMSLFKIVKSEVVSLKHKDFIASAKLLGMKKRLLLFKEILPCIIVPVTVNLIFLFSAVVLAEAALSYLGLGTGTLYPSWGSMINSGQDYITKAWWMIVFPGISLIATLFAVNSYGRKLRFINSSDND